MNKKLLEIARKVAKVDKALAKELLAVTEVSGVLNEGVRLLLNEYSVVNDAYTKWYKNLMSSGRLGTMLNGFKTFKNMPKTVTEEDFAKAIAHLIFNDLLLNDLNLTSEQSKLVKNIKNIIPN